MGRGSYCFGYQSSSESEMNVVIHSMLSMARHASSQKHDWSKQV